MLGSYSRSQRCFPPHARLLRSARMATPRSRHAARLRADRRRAQQRARRFALLAVVAVLAVVTLGLTAFDNEGGGAQAVSRPAPLPMNSEPPEPQVLATVGNLRVQSPVARGGINASTTTSKGTPRKSDGSSSRRLAS